MSRRTDSPETVDCGLQHDHPCSSTAEVRLQRSDRRSPRRRHKRLGVSKRVEYSCKNRSTFGYTKDIGSGGMFVRTSGPLVEGVELDFRLLLGTGKPLVTQGRVVRRSVGSSESGFAISFVGSATTDSRERIATFVLETLEKRGLDRLKLNPRNISELSCLGDIYIERNRLEDAETCFRNILESRPGHTKAHGSLAEILLVRAGGMDDKKLLAEALRLFNVALTDPELQYLQDPQAVCSRALQSIHARDQQLVVEGSERETVQQAQIVQRVQDNQAGTEQLRQQRHAVEPLKAQLAKARKKVEGARTALRRQEHALEAREEACGEFEKQLTEQQQQQQMRGQSLEALAVRLSKDGRELEKREAHLQQEKRQFAAERTGFQATVDEGEHGQLNLHPLQQELAREVGAHRERCRQLEAAEQTLEKAQSRLASEQKDQAQRVESLDVRASALRRQSEHLNEVDRRLKSERQQLESRKTRLDQAEQHHSRERESYRALVQKAKQTQKALTRSKADLAAKRQALQRGQNDLGDKQADLAKRAVELANLQKQLATEDREIEEARRFRDQQHEIKAGLMQRARAIEASQRVLAAEKEQLTRQHEELSRLRAAVQRDKRGLQEERKQRSDKEVEDSKAVDANIAATTAQWQAALEQVQGRERTLEAQVAALSECLTEAQRQRREETAMLSPRHASSASSALQPAPGALSAPSVDEATVSPDTAGLELVDADAVELTAVGTIAVAAPDSAGREFVLAKTVELPASNASAVGSSAIEQAIESALRETEDISAPDRSEPEAVQENKRRLMQSAGLRRGFQASLHSCGKTIATRIGTVARALASLIAIS